MDAETCAPGGPLALGVSRCETCAGRRIPFRRARAALAYRGAAREVVHALKYAGVREVAAPIAGRAVAQWPRASAPVPCDFFDVDQVTFVPLAPGRERDRGYNQAEVLGRALAAHTGVPARPWLAQDRPTEDQVGLDASARRANVAAAYRLRAGLPAPERRILLVDDVYTTGATAETCARLLRRAGWAEVRAWTLARVVRGAYSTCIEGVEYATPGADTDNMERVASLGVQSAGRVTRSTDR
jgi:ComF family protein